MRKILLDFHVPETPEQVQKYLALTLELPDYYGENLDALYDVLTDVGEDTCIGVFRTEKTPKLTGYLRRVKKVLRDAEEANPRLCVIFDDWGENFGGSSDGNII